jgi:hypothetical protein
MVVTSIADLRKLPRDPRVNGLLERSRLAVRVPGLLVSDQLRLEGVLNRYQSRCGCTAGAACFLGALVAGGVYVAPTNGSHLSFGFLKDAAAVLAAAFVLGFLAKLVALQVTRWQFSAACRRFERELSNRPALHASLGAHTQTGG